MNPVSGIIIDALSIFIMYTENMPVRHTVNEGMFKSWTLTFCLSLLLFSVQAQISIMPYWLEPVNQTTASIQRAESLLSVEIGYWFRMKTKRLEFYPAIQFGVDRRFARHFWGVRTDLQVYPFDFKSDCKCPNFSKKYNFFKKGLFILVGPGITRHEAEEKQSLLLPQIRTGIGQDIGLNNLLTLSPIVAIQINTNSSAQLARTYLQGMLRLTFRWDKKNF